MKAQIIHYGTVVISVCTAAAGLVTELTGTLPQSYRVDAVAVAAILSAAALGVKAFDAALAQAQMDNDRIDS